MSIVINMRTGGIDRIGIRKTYHIFTDKDFGRVEKRIKKFVSKYKSVNGYATDNKFEGVSEVILENSKDVKDWMHDLKCMRWKIY
jgi:hypothetical protein